MPFRASYWPTALNLSCNTLFLLNFLYLMKIRLMLIRRRHFLNRSKERNSRGEKMDNSKEFIIYYLIILLLLLLLCNFLIILRNDFDPSEHNVHCKEGNKINSQTSLLTREVPLAF